MDEEIIRMRAHIDQTRAGVERTLRSMPPADVASLVKACAGARFDEMNERVRLLVGLLAVVAVFQLLEEGP